jgi:hypothetical protein
MRDAVLLIGGPILPLCLHDYGEPHSKLLNLLLHHTRLVSCVLRTSCNIISLAVYRRGDQPVTLIGEDRRGRRGSLVVKTMEEDRALQRGGLIGRRGSLGRPWRRTRLCKMEEDANSLIFIFDIDSRV